MRVFFFSPLLDGQSDSYKDFSRMIGETLEAEVIRHPTIKSGESASEWINGLKKKISTADAFMILSPSQTISVLGDSAPEITDLVIDRLENGAPSIITLGWPDIPDTARHSQSVVKSLQSLYRSIEARPLDIRVSSSHIEIGRNQYTFQVDHDDILHPHYLGESGKLWVNQANLLLYDRRCSPLVLAQTNVQLVGAGDQLQLSVPGVRPAIALYRKLGGSFTMVGSGSMFQDSYRGPSGQLFTGASDNREFATSMISEVGKAAAVFENRAEVAYRYFVRCERGVGILLHHVSRGDVKSILTKDTAAKLDAQYSNDIGRLTLLDMLESIRSRTRWPVFESYMFDPRSGTIMKRKDFASLVDDINGGLRNILAHPAKSVLGQADISDEDQKNLEILSSVIWSARVHFGCTGDTISGELLS